MKRTTWVIIAVSLILGGLYFANENQNQETGPLKIGVLGAFTGEAAVYGEPFRNVVMLAVDEINKSGGINGQKIEAIYEDDKCSGAIATSAVTKLINVDKVKIIIGSVCSSATLAAVPIAEKAKVLILSPAASSPDLTGISPFFFRTYPSDAEQGKVLAELANKKGYKKVAFIQENKDFPLGILKSFESGFTKYGGVVIKEEFLTETTDFRSSLIKLRNQNPDALYVDTQTPGGTERILKQLSEIGWKPQLFVNDVVSGDPVTVSNNKAFLEGTFAAEFGIDENNLIFQNMLKSYKGKYGDEVAYQSYAQTEYDSIYLISDGIKEVGYDGEKLALWSRTVKDWKGASGETTISKDGDRLGGPVAKVIHNGKTEVLK
ncbi:MAG: hypothetical protein JWN37_179 [Candidatus Nomurabacteria bacterium]|nr:hypothetical protein [Candidatus Nomurabacteria bacterium]